MHQCRPDGRPAASRRNRRRRHRPVPHRAAVHDLARVPARERAACALPGGARRRRRAAGDVPHARHRRRQGAALHARPSRRKTRRSAGARSGSGSTGRACCAAQVRALLKAAVGRELKIMFPMVADGRRVRPRQGDGRARAHPSAAPRLQPAERVEARRHDRGALAPVPARRIARARRLPLGRLERSDAVPVRGRPRQSAASPTASTRLGRRCCARSSDIVEQGRGLRRAGDAVRRDGIERRSTRWPCSRSAIARSR